MGPRTLGRGHNPCRNDEKENGRRSKGLFDRRPGRTTGIYPGRAYLPKRNHGDWVSTRQIKRRLLITCVGEAFEGLREGERDKEGARTGRGNGDDVVVA